ncbi:alpha/beta hydrolase [Nonomuraea sp. SMC257]|uniref:Alpha/beta hydrolase n=1 Tax=Nonomuraea montanisoli TaxID=2741721 RepID=A0A7Y6IH80_9ACTN|nr:alpha/beta hydrolase [Nonomuraea montanisoli]NUW38097.1 alpha/beta hydrolase [Nonomuraea montanisoli]
MTTYVLVPGAWHGPTAWDRVVPLLERAGARTVTLDLAATPATGLDEHVQQVITALDALEASTFATPTDDEASETTTPNSDTPRFATSAPEHAATSARERVATSAPEHVATSAPEHAATSAREHVETPAPEHVDVPAREHGRVVLVGHSYAGLVIRQAADRRPDRVEHLVLIDAWVGPDGAGLFTLAPEAFADRIRAAADESGLIPAPAPAMYGVTEPDDAEWLRTRLRPHPLRTFTDTTTLTGAVDRIPGTALYCRPQSLPFDRLAEKLGYRTVPVDGPHDVMVTDPETVARHLLDIPQVQNREAPELQ